VQKWPRGEEIVRKTHFAHRSLAREVNYDDFGTVICGDQEAVAMDCYRRRDPVDLDLRGLDIALPKWAGHSGDAFAANDEVLYSGAGSRIVGVSDVPS
jgi:hypothetical protein